MKTIEKISLICLIGLLALICSCKKEKEVQQEERLDLSGYHIAGTLAPAHIPFVITFDNTGQANFSNGFSANGMNAYTWGNGVLKMADYTFEIANGSIKKSDAIFENPVLVKTPAINAFAGKSFGGSGTINGTPTTMFIKFHATNPSFVLAATLADLATSTSGNTFTPLNNVSFYINESSFYAFAVLLNNKLELYQKDKSGKTYYFSLTQQ